MNRAILVLGPASSGTKLTTEILVKNGCYGEFGHVQNWDNAKFLGDPVVWRRSVPHRNWWLNLSELLERSSDYEFQAVVTSRNLHCMADSQVKSGHAKDFDVACVNIERANTLIIPQLVAADIPFFISNYEALILHPMLTQRALCSFLGLKFKNTVDIQNQNTKHWTYLFPTS